MMDEQKIWVMMDWSLPWSVHAVLAFLGLAGYYRLFIKNYDANATPLTALVNKDTFKWNEEAAF
jgi:hypothetical protein